MRRIVQHPASPIALLLIANLMVGIFTYHSYGLSWDEPLFYNYADSIRLAYSPQAFQPGFNFEQVYGRSAEDHKYYGPAYLLLAWPIQRAIMLILNADMASAWHLVNFLGFELGLYFFYRLGRKWLDPWPATASTLFFATQPVLWGHAFINPKDIPFMTAFLAALTLGLEFIDQIWPAKAELPQKKQTILPGLLLAGLSLGITSAIRVIGPLAGVLVCSYALLRLISEILPGQGKAHLTGIRQRLGILLVFILLYAGLGILSMYALWPFLWANPVSRLLEVLRHMSDNPTELAVLFMGQIFHADNMPHRYLPQLLALTFTEATWPLFVLGIFAALRKFALTPTPPPMGEGLRPLSHREKAGGEGLLVLFALFAGMLSYIVTRTPAMYDGFRHFFFIMPPVFIFAGLGLDWVFKKLSGRLAVWARLAALAVCVLPALLGIPRLQPYEYTYYNSFTGGTGGAFRQYETDYWLTCYPEALDWVRENAPEKTVHIQREFELANYYGSELNLVPLEKTPPPGDLLLFSTRANLDKRSEFRKLPIVTNIGRDGASFCIIKQNP